MMRRVSRYPPERARLVRLEHGPPMYRQLGYADKTNQHSDLCDPPPPGYFGPFSIPRLKPNRTLPFGPGIYGLPAFPFAYTTHYWDPDASACDLPCVQTAYFRMYDHLLPETRPEARFFPEMAVPGSGTQSKFTNSGYRCTPGLPPPQVSFCL